MRRRRAAFGANVDVTTPVYVISVAAELTGLHPQTLRTYDRLGLVSPGRTGGGGRRYSMHDIDQLRRVTELTASGIGLEGVRRILELENHVTALQARVAELEDELGHARSSLERALHTDPTLPVPVTQHSTAVVVWGSKRRRRRRD